MLMRILPIRQLRCRIAEGNRLETLGETMRAALNSLAVTAPDWLAKRLKKDWSDRYGRRVENYRLPKLDSEREVLGTQMGEDGFNLLKKVYVSNARLVVTLDSCRGNSATSVGSTILCS